MFEVNGLHPQGVCSESFDMYGLPKMLIFFLVIYCSFESLLTKAQYHSTCVPFGTMLITLRLLYLHDLMK